MHGVKNLLSISDLFGQNCISSLLLLVLLLSSLLYLFMQCTVVLATSDKIYSIYHNKTYHIKLKSIQTASTDLDNIYELGQQRGATHQEAVDVAAGHQVSAVAALH